MEVRVRPPFWIRPGGAALCDPRLIPQVGGLFGIDVAVMIHSKGFTGVGRVTLKVEVMHIAGLGVENDVPIG